ncbi:MAG: hypothetical protein ACRDK4_10395 [Solirubrobacteraceae bacterium]
MSSTALKSWREERREHLDDLLDAHKLVGGPAPGRRWRTTAINDALILRLAAEFQGFARDLHDQTSDIFASWLAPSSPTAQRVVRNRLVEGRELERGNAHPGSIGRDFGRFGFEVWRELHNRDERTTNHNESLALLNDARNGLAHSDEAKLAALRDKGHPPVLSTFRKWRRDLDILAANLDAEMSDQLARLFDRRRPW